MVRLRTVTNGVFGGLGLGAGAALVLWVAGPSAGAVALAIGLVATGAIGARSGGPGGRLARLGDGAVAGGVAGAMLYLVVGALLAVLAGQQAILAFGPVTEATLDAAKPAILEALSRTFVLSSVAVFGLPLVGAAFGAVGGWIGEGSEGPRPEWRPRSLGQRGQLFGALLLVVVMSALQNLKATSSEVAADLGLPEPSFLGTATLTGFTLIALTTGLQAWCTAGRWRHPDPSLRASARYELFLSGAIVGLLLVALQVFTPEVYRQPEGIVGGLLILGAAAVGMTWVANAPVEPDEPFVSPGPLVVRDALLSGLVATLVLVGGGGATAVGLAFGVVEPLRGLEDTVVAVTPVAQRAWYALPLGGLGLFALFSLFSPPTMSFVAGRLRALWSGNERNPQR